MNVFTRALGYNRCERGKERRWAQNIGMLAHPPDQLIKECSEVIEECSKVIKSVCKAKRFGAQLPSRRPEKTPNFKLLENELDDLETRIEEFRLWLPIHS